MKASPSKPLYFVLLLSCLCMAGCTQQPGNAREVSGITKTGASRSAGEQLFVQRCSVCHGKDGTAGIANAANLQTSVLELPAIKETITNGRGAMPPFGRMLDAQQIAQVAEYVHSLKKQSPR